MQGENLKLLSSVFYKQRRDLSAVRSFYILHLWCTVPINSKQWKLECLISAHFISPMWVFSHLNVMNLITRINLTNNGVTKLRVV